MTKKNKEWSEELKERMELTQMNMDLEKERRKDHMLEIEAKRSMNHEFFEQQKELQRIKSAEIRRTISMKQRY